MFEDRIDAARQLLPHLQEYRQKDSIVLSIPRGGVPIGYHIAQALHVPLDVVLTKKIGHPAHKELAIGAVSLNSCILDSSFEIPKGYIEEQTRRIREDLKRKYELYRGKKGQVSLEGKYVILTDDGIATGSTMLATIQLVRQNNPAQMIVAVPVSSRNAKQMLEPEVSKFICLKAPPDFRAVSQYYKEYKQVSDEEVVALLHP